MNTTVRRIAAVGGATAVAVLALGTPALAHVSVDPAEVPGGGYATLNFKVPNERDNASTVKLEVTLPTDHPMASVMPEPVPGWKIEVETGKLDKPIESHGNRIEEAPTKITWSGGEIEPGTFQRFPVSVGQLPDNTDRIAFKALQTYDNKEVVRWIEVPEGEQEPEFPAPVLALGEAADDGHGGSADSDGKAGRESAAERDGTDSAQESTSTTDTTARVLGGVGIALGVAGVAYGVLAGRRRDATD
ncbi:YcnI family protein [Streptomyces sp. XM4193]|uniref:YcnI family copper-binding membrane protein n=1 Tax=Streptomyces sp. XM4193 TaxID=2929782 RepID=UPI001FF99ABE|nr:YcnI family protein [Streptomyces sp. XM4193]MCK1794708.1 YcnI family protein [Streptomyces sp. XM4193]